MRNEPAAQPDHRWGRCERLRRLPDESIECVRDQPAVLPAARLPSRRAARPRSATSISGSTKLAPSPRGCTASWCRPAASGSTSATPTPPIRRKGAPRKSLLLGPERLASRSSSDGWMLRNKIVWAKTNPMPTSVRDRLTCTWEVVYVFAKQPRYFFDLDAIRVPHTSQHRRPRSDQTSSADRARPGAARTATAPPAWTR